MRQVATLEALQMPNKSHHLGGLVKNGLRAVGQAVLAHGLGGKVRQHHNRSLGPLRHGLFQEGQAIARLQTGLQHQDIPVFGVGPQPVRRVLLGRGTGHTDTYIQIDEGGCERL